MKNTIALALLAIGLISLASANAVPVTIDFGTGTPSSNLAISPYSESGFLFTQVAGPGSVVGPFVSAGDGSLTVGGTVQITRIGGGLFDLLSLDMVFRGGLDALGTFDLLTSAGGTQNLTALGNYTFSGAAFEGLSWVNLVDVQAGFFTDNNTVDNLVLSPAAAAVPDTSSTFGLLFLSLTALLGMGARLRSLQSA